MVSSLVSLLKIAPWTFPHYEVGGDQGGVLCTIFMLRCAAAGGMIIPAKVGIQIEIIPSFFAIVGHLLIR